MLLVSLTGRDLEAHAQNTLLALGTNVLGPFYKACKILYRLRYVPDAKCFRRRLEQRILWLGCCSRGLHDSQHNVINMTSTNADIECRKDSNTKFALPRVVNTAHLVREGCIQHIPSELPQEQGLVFS